MANMDRGNRWNSQHSDRPRFQDEQARRYGRPHEDHSHRDQAPRSGYQYEREGWEQHPGGPRFQGDSGSQGRGDDYGGRGRSSSQGYDAYGQRSSGGNQDIGRHGPDWNEGMGQQGYGDGQQYDRNYGEGYGRQGGWHDDRSRGNGGSWDRGNSSMGNASGGWTSSMGFGTTAGTSGSGSFNRAFESRGLGHSGKGPKGYQRSDERIKEQLSDRLMDDDDVDASDITIEVKDGEVTLTGTVMSKQEKRAAEECVERASGVRDVINQLRVKRESPDDSVIGGSRSGQSTSDEIARPANNPRPQR